MVDNGTVVREAAAPNVAQEDWESESLGENWVYILIFIVLVSCFHHRIRGALRHAYLRLRTPRWKKEVPKPKYRVKCYGRGKVHEAILKKLNISESGDRPGIPCILFVYKVSRDNEDLRNALQWVTESTRKEDIFVVFLLVKTLEKSNDVGEEEITGLDFFHQGTKVVRVRWKERRDSQPEFSCPEAIRTITEMFNQRNVRNEDVGQRARNRFYLWGFGLGVGSILILILTRSI